MVVLADSVVELASEVWVLAAHWDTDKHRHHHILGREYRQDNTAALQNVDCSNGRPSMVANHQELP